MYQGEELALAQAGDEVDGAKVVLRRLDDATAGAGSTPALVGQSARIAAADQSTIAYIGELMPGSSLTSIQILSPAGILQVSPGDSATGLAGKTFARVVPRDSDEADAQLAALRKLGVSSIYLLADRTTHGRDIATTILSDAPSYGIRVVDPTRNSVSGNTRLLLRAIKRSKAGALLYAGSPAASVGPLWNAVTAAAPSIKKIASASITDSTSWPLTSVQARYDTYLSAPGLLPGRGLPRAGSQFQSDFMTAYGTRAPWESGIFGYVAVSGVLSALHSVGIHAGNPRAGVVSAFLRLRELPSALGAYSVVGGQTSFRSYFFTTYTRSGVAKSDGSLS
jgi:branched-chain amino acid transport system substrate-binding protein